MSGDRIGARLAAVAALAAGLAVTTMTPCRAEPPAETTFELIRPAGDVYDERTSDGDAYPPSLAVRGTVALHGFAVSFSWWRNAYLTESAGPGSFTRYARLEGGFGTVAPLVATESSFEARVERRVSRVLPLYAGIGGDRTWTNYHYPSLTGVGAGAELRAIERPGARAFASAYYYPSASGSYVTETAPARTLRPAFSILKLEAGIVLRTRSPVYGIVGYVNETRSGHDLPSDVRFIRSDPYLGIGARL